MSVSTHTTARAASLVAGVAVVLLASTMFKEQVARAAAQLIDAHVTNVDANGYIAVHEQGTAKVRVTNPSLLVQPQAAAPWHAVAYLHTPYAGASSLRTLAGPNPGSIAVTSLTMSRLYGAARVQLGARVVSSPTCPVGASFDELLWDVQIVNMNPDGDKADILVVPFPTPLQTAPPPPDSKTCLYAWMSQSSGIVEFIVNASGFYGK